MSNINAFKPDKHILVNDRVLLKIESIEDNINGILLTDESLSKFQQAVVKGELISWSKGALDKLSDTPKKGDYIYFETYAGRLLFTKDQTERYRHISINDITGFESKE